MMKLISRIICVLFLILCGSGIFVVGVSLFVQQQSWPTFGGMITIGGIGFMLVQLGIAVAQGQTLKELLDMLLFVAGAGSR